jgi:hypothetical protein
MKLYQFLQYFCFFSHDQFLASSDLFHSKFTSSSTTNAPHASSSFEQLTNKHYGQILGTIATLLSQFHRLGAQAQGCLLEWLQIVSAQIADQQLRTIKKVYF